jgi:hypothetical protein
MGGKQSDVRCEAEVTQRFLPAEQIHMLPCDSVCHLLLTANSSHGHQVHFIAGNGDGTTGAS